MKIIFLTTQFSGLSGGAIYDEYFFNKLNEYFTKQVILREDKDFKNEENKFVKNYIKFANIYKTHAQDLTDCDYLFINSRLYTRFIKFPWFKKGRSKIVVIHHHFNYQSNKGFKRIVHYVLEMNFLSHADWIITPNIFTLDVLNQKGFKDKSVLIESNINNEIHKSSIPVLNQFLFVGTVEPRKGLHFALKAFARFHENHQSFSYLIAGSFNPDNSYIKSLKRIISYYHLENYVKFLGRITEEQKENLYNTSMAFLFPSQNEGYGYVLVEAMSYGIPVIAYDNTAMPYTVNSSNGVLVKNHSIAKMTEAMEKLVNDPTYRERLCNGAFETVRNLPDKIKIEKEYQHFFEIMRKGKI